MALANTPAPPNIPTVLQHKILLTTRYQTSIPKKNIFDITKTISGRVSKARPSASDIKDTEKIKKKCGKGLPGRKFFVPIRGASLSEQVG